jgi:anaerobic magnesium-protoporphyrin IX monomethyl ester cyclase
MKLLFIQLSFHPNFPDSSTLATTYNDGIYYVASFIMEEFPFAEIEMCQMMWGEKPEEFPLETYDFIMISCLATHFWSNISTLDNIAARKHKSCKIIMGGPHPAFAPWEALRFADYVILGEGEVPLAQLIHALSNGSSLDSVDNLCYIGNTGELVINAFKRFKHFTGIINPLLLKRAPRLHWATVSMSRGCPFNCSFCYAIRLLGRTFRTKGVNDIRRELDGIYLQTGCNRFYVTDLNFTTRKDFCHDIASAVKDAGYKFVAMTRIDLADDLELLQHLKEAGFNEYCLGVESEDPDVLGFFNKKVDAGLQTQRLLTYAEHNVYIHSAIIFGLESQDLAAIHRTAKWCADARIMHPTFVCLAEYPFQHLLFGSRQDIEDHRIIQQVPTYQHYSFVGIFPRHMRPSELQKGIIDSYEIFFKHAFEIEKRPQRRTRLKMYERSIAVSIPGMKKHIEYLENLEKPFYTSEGTLKENRLEEVFNERYGKLKEWLSQTRKLEKQFEKMFAK